MGLLSFLSRSSRAAGPDVVVDVRFEDGLFFLDLMNIGGGSAFRVSVKFEPEIRGLEGRHAISEMALFRGVEFMPPGKTISTFLDDSSAYFAREEPTRFEAEVVFHDGRDKQLSNRIRHDLGIYRDVGYIRRGPR